MSHAGVYRENKHPGDDRLGLIFKTRHIKLVHIISSNTGVGWSEHSASDGFLIQVSSEKFLGSSMYLQLQTEASASPSGKAISGSGPRMICWDMVGTTVGSLVVFSSCMS